MTVTSTRTDSPDRVVRLTATWASSPMLSDSASHSPRLTCAVPGTVDMPISSVRDSPTVTVTWRPRAHTIGALRWNTVWSPLSPQKAVSGPQGSTSANNRQLLHTLVKRVSESYRLVGAERPGI